MPSTGQVIGGSIDRIDLPLAPSVASLPNPAAVLAYSGRAATSANEPPTFVVVGKDHRIAPPAVMQGRVLAPRRAGVTVKVRPVPGPGHGVASEGACYPAAPAPAAPAGR